jgi:hypothetical protein
MMPIFLMLMEIPWVRFWNFSTIKSDGCLCADFLPGDIRKGEVAGAYILDQDVLNAGRGNLMSENHRSSDHCRFFKESISFMSKPVIHFYAQNYHIHKTVSSKNQGLQLS